ncbi:hypothetical protein pEaSNUABM40_00164 [Erwinia phage pEa_SNUABM_40]|uniref:Uncharacterized protein n=1 Tax=Erwinia phage pEa_SNUABM_3 TaxID=2869552 RepID=A0AAE7XJ82_9CAUD|nr:hypothetical protein MPK68_gp163 [Erwinia phage pEa_SNUABM_3]QZE56699.1 hypothetical protein pEaSNUABM20_00163 [Erwinia phage pEa_SNUABM_20]QZE58380.1 hypothetical protein pEaSNUABM40_00164 [Erwinia phage pEa_SNUABM_40]UAW52944.1 hypothetical protein pEaSNUABM23_00162 [Erwinia phage pEa_SNUABM_23]UIW10840.1 hypothetical protein pEaSNUABM23_00162 [Erwinia phage pEa_SNUABM_31]QZE56360.1 hypothetical protein pEaSNUABM3_00163 [Erwinia phage pEa_SNUABM_3]
MLLNELNALLAEHRDALKLPSFRAEVSASGNNLHWLHKNLKRNPQCPQRIAELVAKPLSELTRP